MRAEGREGGERRGEREGERERRGGSEGMTRWINCGSEGERETEIREIC